MTNYFRNLEESIHREDGKKTLSLRLKFWLNGHWRLVGNLVMMFIFACICLWGAYIAGEKNSQGSIIESVIPEIRDARDVDGRMEDAIRSSNRP
jgi:hypothetical protein